MAVPIVCVKLKKKRWWDLPSFNSSFVKEMKFVIVSMIMCWSKHNRSSLFVGEVLAKTPAVGKHSNI